MLIRKLGHVGSFKGLFPRPAPAAKPAKAEKPAPQLTLWKAHINGSFVTAEGRTKSEARAEMKRLLGGPIPPGTVIEKF